MTILLPLAPPMGAAIGLLYLYLREGLTPAEIWRTSSAAYKIVSCGSVFLAALMLTTIGPT